MLLANRRIALLYLCLAGMEAAWITPFWLIIYAPAPPPWAAYGSLLAGLLVWTLTLELLSRAGVRIPGVRSDCAGADGGHQLADGARGPLSRRVAG